MKRSLREMRGHSFPLKIPPIGVSSVTITEIYTKASSIIKKKKAINSIYDDIVKSEKAVIKQMMKLRNSCVA